MTLKMKALLMPDGFFSLIQQNGSIEFQSTEPEVPNIDEGTKLKDGTRVFRTSGTSGFQKKVYHDEETISNAVEGLVDRVGGVIRLIAVYQFIMLVVGCR